MGPVGAGYAPNGQDYAFMTGTEYGDPVSVTLRNTEGETVYQKELKNYKGGFKWLKAEDGALLAVFYCDDECTWMDRVNADTGEKETFKVLDECFYWQYLGVDFLDADSIIYCKKIVSAYREENDGVKSEYEICKLSGGEPQKPEIDEDRTDLRIKVLRPWDYGAIVVKLPGECAVKDEVYYGD